MFVHPLDLVLPFDYKHASRQENRMTSPDDLKLVFKLRVVVARFGEMDLARWWNTRGQLGRMGATALQRGFPKTYRFAQARSVFGVAAKRCSEVFDPPNCVTLWRLPDALEEEIDASWENWLDASESWSQFFEAIQAPAEDNLVDLLGRLELISKEHLESFSRLRRSAEGRAVPLPGVFSGSRTELVLLGLGFGRGQVGALAVPYARTSVQ
jgi:hypothetical protein